jgi:uncharacterized membrane protein required for colicin V production
MNSIDIFIIIGISLFIVLGYRDGFFKKVFGILGFWAGFILAIKFIDPVSSLISEWMGYSVEVSLVFAFFVIFVATVVVVNLLYRWFGKSTNENLTVRSRVAGAVLGAGEGLVAVSLVLLMFTMFDMPSDDDRRQSVLYTKMTHIAPRVFDYSTQWIPSSQQFFDVMRSKVQKFGLPR